MIAPRLTGSRRCRASAGVRSSLWIPDVGVADVAICQQMRGGSAAPQSIGTAKPMPAAPPWSLRIWAVIPIARPRASSSGPPEEPWPIGASVWIASISWNSGAVRAAIERRTRRDDPDRERVGVPERAADGGHRLADDDASPTGRAGRARARGRRGRPGGRRRRRRRPSPRSARAPGRRRRTGRRRSRRPERCRSSRRRS